MESLKERIKTIKKRRPGYALILDFYEKVRSEQEHAKGSVKTGPIVLKPQWKELLAREGFPLLQPKDFSLDTATTVHLLHSLCQIAKRANPRMAEEASKIERFLEKESSQLEEALRVGWEEKKIEAIADHFGFDRNIFVFLVLNSVKPSVESGMEKLRTEVTPEDWSKGHCPICGSLPQLSLLREEVGKRYLLCSFCSHEWRIERLVCPFCHSREPRSLHYLSGEGEEGYRADLCENCHAYLKTIDTRKIETVDPLLEDIASLHLDLAASAKGFHRPVPNRWTA